MLQKSIAVCGIKNAGKTSAAKALAELLNWRFLDTDDILVESFAMKTGRRLLVRDIYQKMGERDFRMFEAECIRTLSIPQSGRVLALGGGLLSNPYFTADDRSLLGTICWLDTPDEVAFERILKDGLPPFLQNEPEPFQSFCKMNEERKMIFRQVATHYVRVNGTQTPEDTAKYIFNLYQGKK